MKMRKQLTLSFLVAVLLCAGYAGADIKLKGGLGTFTGDVGEYTSWGPSWGLAMGFDLPLGLIGIELAYEGSRNGLSDTRAPLSTGLLRNGATGIVKVSPLPLPIVNPFIGAGLGADYVSIQGQETAARYQSGFALELPIAVGIELNLLLLTVGARATYHLFLTQQFAIPTGGSRGNLFDVTATVGLKL